MDLSTYQHCREYVKKIFELLQRHNLPHQNAFAFANAFCKQNAVLRSSPDYLVLLSILWSPNAHIFIPESDREWFQTPISNAATPTQLFQALEPEQFEAYYRAWSDYRLFRCSISSTSQDFPRRFNAIRKLLLQQRDLFAQYDKWLREYTAQKTHLKSTVNKIIASESMDDIPDDCVIRLMKIAQEYLKNLMVESKNRRKYEGAYDRISAYIKSANTDFNDDLDDDADEVIADDIIGSIFERMLKIAKHCDAIRPIGPMYLCWMLEYRLLKVTNPQTDDIDKINLLLTNSKNEELFPLKIEWHASRPSVSDESRVYLFDEICVLWEEYIDANTALSKFLFEKTLPYYREFLKCDRQLQPAESITHHYVHYNPYVFSSELLQRCLSVFQQMFTLHVSDFPVRLRITDDTLRFLGETTNTPIPETLQQLYDQYFKPVTDICKSWANSKRKITLNSKYFINEVARVLREKTLLDEFTDLMFLNPIAYGACYRKERSEFTEWDQIFYKWLCDIRASMNFEWKIQPRGYTGSIDALVDHLYNPLCQADRLFILNTVVPLYSVYAAENIVESLVKISKEAFFYNQYSEEQYQQLLDF